MYLTSLYPLLLLPIYLYFSVKLIMAKSKSLWWMVVIAGVVWILGRLVDQMYLGIQMEIGIPEQFDISVRLIEKFKIDPDYWFETPLKRIGDMNFYFAIYFTFFHKWASNIANQFYNKIARK